jgi:hypothetical protein
MTTLISLKPKKSVTVQFFWDVSEKMNVHGSNILQANEWQCLLFSEMYVANEGTAITDRRKENKNNSEGLRVA